MSYIYLASPYSHREPRTRRKRYLAARDAVAWLLNQRQWVYSPIVHCHALSLAHDLPTHAAFWREYNFAMLAPASELMILTLPNWATSGGIIAERAEATRLGLPVTYLRPELCGIADGDAL